MVIHIQKKAFPTHDPPMKKCFIMFLTLLASVAPSLCSAGTTATIDVFYDASSNLTITLSGDITLKVTTGTGNVGAGFLFEGATNATSSVYYDNADISGEINVNSTAYGNLMVVSGYHTNDIDYDDLVLTSIGSFSGSALVSGDYVTLSAGTYATTTSLAYTVLSGTYTVNLVDTTTGAIIDSAVVPEPSKSATGIGVVALGLITIRKIVKKRKTQLIS
jgi:hypothetical protein